MVAKIFVPHFNYEQMFALHAEHIMYYNLCSMALIELKNIDKSYGKGKVVTQVLKDVSLEIEKGEFVAIVGASGSGKTTLMNIVGLLDKPDSGTYHFKGKDITQLKSQDEARLRRGKIGFVFQSFSLIPRMSARANMELPMVYDRISRKDRKFQSNKLLKLVGLSEQSKNKPSQLSGGQLQRVTIARALANRPELILADEPTGNLDSKTGANILKVLGKLNQRGNTVVLITHDPKVAQYASRTITILDGKVKSTRRRQQAIKAPEAKTRRA